MTAAKRFRLWCDFHGQICTKSFKDGRDYPVCVGKEPTRVRYKRK